MEDLGALSELAVIVGAGVVAAFIAVKLRLPSIVGYLVAGIMISLLFPDLLHSEFTEQIAQIGAALLLFTIGVEFSLETIKRVRNIVVVGALLQAAIVVGTAIVFLPMLGFDDYQSFFIGILASTSSTAFVLKMLESRDEVYTKAGNVMLGWLIVQDILIILWFLLLQTFAPNLQEAPDLFFAIIKSILVVGVAFGVGQYLLPPIMVQVAKTKSDELMIVAVVGIIAAFAVFANSLGVSFTIGAFLAGLALSESFVNHEVFTETKSLRNLLLMIFFVSIGSLFDVDLVLMNLGSLLMILLVLIGIKIISIVAISVWFDVHIKNALKVGLGISQIGEFAFLGAQIGLLSGWIDAELYSILTAATLISMAATPVLHSNAGWFYKLLERNARHYSPNIYRGFFLNSIEDDFRKSKISGHVVLCGYGRVGKYIATALAKSSIEFIVIELDAANADQAKKNGLSVIYGDATNPDILTQAELSTAKAIVIALPGREDNARLIQSAREANPHIKIVARAHSSNSNTLSPDLIDHIIEPEFEAAVQIISALYKIMHRRNKRAIESLAQLHVENWAPEPKVQPQTSVESL